MGSGGAVISARSPGASTAGPAGEKVLPYTIEIGIMLLWVAAILTMYTGYDYFRAGLKHVVDE